MNLSSSAAEDFDSDVLLFDLANDLEQRVNLSEKYPQIVQAMDALLQQYRDQGHSVVRP